MINPRLDEIGSTAERLQCGKLDKCCRKTDYVPKEKLCTDRYPTPQKCGRRNEKGIGGSVETIETTIESKDSYPYANYAEFPWMMAVLSMQTAGSISLNVFRSGGSLIHPKIVLTAAHNVQNIPVNKLFVRGGEWDTQTENEMCKHEERFVERVITHEDFDDTNYQHDVSLIVLKEPFQLTPFINTVCLPPKNKSFNGQRCLSSGWGKTKFGRDERYQVFLKRIDLAIVDSKSCQELLRRTLLGEDFVLEKNFLCAGEFFSVHHIDQRHFLYFRLKNLFNPLQAAKRELTLVLETEVLHWFVQLTAILTIIIKPELSSQELVVGKKRFPDFMLTYQNTENGLIRKLQSLASTHQPIHSKK